MLFIGFNRKDSESSRSSTQIAWLSTNLETLCQFGTNRLKEWACYDSTEQSTRLSNVPEGSRCKRVVYVLLDAFCENLLDCAGLRSGARTVSRPVSYTHLDVYKRQQQTVVTIYQVVSVYNKHNVQVTYYVNQSMHFVKKQCLHQYIYLYPVKYFKDEKNKMCFNCSILISVHIQLCILYTIL